MKKICIIICSVLFTFSIVTGITTKLSFSNILVENPDFNEYYLESASPILTNEELLDYSKELDKADFVAKVRFTGERELSYNSMLSTVFVLEVFVGDTELTGKNVQIYESNFFNLQYKLYRDFSIVNLMNAGDEYLVFGVSTTNIYSEDPNIKFAPANQFEISLFRLKENNDVLLDEKVTFNGATKYGSMAQNEFICYTEEQLNLILDFKYKYLKMYNLEL